MARMAEILRQVAFADQYHANPRHLFQDLRQVCDGALFFAHNYHEDLASRIERPDIGPAVVFRRGEAPVAGGGCRRVAALLIAVA